MRIIKRVIILVAVTSLFSCNGRIDKESNFEESRSTEDLELVVGGWKSGKQLWSAMHFMKDGTVRLENSKGESLFAYWKRVKGSVYKARVNHELVGAYDLVESSTTVPKPVHGSKWFLKPNAVQYQIWSDEASGAEKLPLVTVEGDQLRKDGNEPSDYYERIES